MPAPYSETFSSFLAECGIAATQVSVGITALGRVKMTRLSSYAEAFFPLSIGIERLSKLIIHVDSLLDTGALKSNVPMKRLGHKLENLLDAVEIIAKNRWPGETKFDRPDDPISKGMIRVLGDFASGGRYFNLDALGGHRGTDPANDWHSSVEIPLAKKHYPDKRREKEEGIAALIEQSVGDSVTMRMTRVDGTITTSLEQYLVDTSTSIAIAPWSRLYVLRIIRWLVRVLVRMQRDASHPDLPFFDEFFAGLEGSTDAYIRKTKIWKFGH